MVDNLKYCLACDGTGRIKKICRWCQGKGCQACLGTRYFWFECGSCNGTGIIEGLSTDEPQRIQRFELLKRYGTINPRSIKDFWE